MSSRSSRSSNIDVGSGSGSGSGRAVRGAAGCGGSGVVLLLLLLDELERQPRRPRVARFDRRHLYRNAVAHADKIAVAVAAQHEAGARRADVDRQRRTRGAAIRRPGTAGRLQGVL